MTHHGLPATRYCYFYDVFLRIEFPELQVFLVVIASTCRQGQLIDHHAAADDAEVIGRILARSIAHCTGVTGDVFAVQDSSHI